MSTEPVIHFGPIYGRPTSASLRLCDASPLAQGESHKMSRSLKMVTCEKCDQVIQDLANGRTPDVPAPFVCASCNGTGWFSEEEKEPCDECADGEQHYLKLTGHLPGCGVYEGTQRGPCSCSQSTRT